MLASLFGAFANKKAGGSAVKGAIAGKAGSTVLRALGPVVGTAALGFAAFKGFKKYQEGRDDAGNSSLDSSEVNDNNAAALGSAAISSTAKKKADTEAA